MLHFLIVELLFQVEGRAVRHGVCLPRRRLEVFGRSRVARAEERARRRVVVPPKAARHQSARRVVRVAFGHVAPLVNARELEGKIIVFCAVPVRVGADDVPLRDRHQRSDVFHGLVCKPRFRDAAAWRVSERQNDDDDDETKRQDVGFFFFFFFFFFERRRRARSTRGWTKE